MTTAIFIPARLASSRFPEKILTLIEGKPIILHVLQRAQSLNVGKCYVAWCSEVVKKLVEELGGEAILTDPDLPSGTDRIYAALETLQEKPEIIVNLQGDMPVFSPSIVREIIEIMERNKDIEMATPVMKIKDPEHITNINKAKVVFENMGRGEPGRAIYFSREPIPNGAQQFYLHIGVYAHRYESLSKFVKLPPSYLEKTERLEQLRCLENGINVWAVPVDGYAASVDVPEDLEQIKCCFKNTI